MNPYGIFFCTSSKNFIIFIFVKFKATFSNIKYMINKLFEERQSINQS
jgi:hypothetical protein